ncbi:MAG: hypothetical protein KGQ46_07110 [Hyphomicrobiales bacterium]|nr:hypothetical protein [Hyphomicrobiales bacterium]MDE2114025.1 hypothetical protein [Hyphomicrobiales bacterium]
MTPMRCPYSDTELNAFVDDELPAEQRTGILDYLNGHPETARKVESWRSQRQFLRGQFDAVARETVPVSLSLRANSAIKYTATRLASPVPHAPVSLSIVPPEPMPLPPHLSHSSHGADRRRSWSIFVYGMACAFAMAATMSLILQHGALLQSAGMAAEGLRQPTTNPVLAAPVAVAQAMAPSEGRARLASTVALAPDHENALAALRNYRSFSALPLEFISPNADVLEKSLSQRLGYRLKLPRFADSHWKMVGARLTAENSGPAAFVLYADHGGALRGATIQRGWSANGADSLAVAGLHAVVFGYHDQTVAMVSVAAFDEIGLSDTVSDTAR